MAHCWNRAGKTLDTPSLHRRGSGTGGLGSYLVRFAVSGLLMLCCRPSFAQSDTLSLAQAIDTAEAANLNVAIAQSGLNKSSSHLHESNVAGFPSLAFRSHFLYAPEPGYNDAVTNGGEYGVQLSAEFPLYDGGVRGAIAGQASNDLERSGVNLRRARVEIAFNVRSVYYDLLRAEGEIVAREESVRRLREYTRFLAGQQRGGIASESDLLKSRVDLNNETILLETARRGRDEAMLRLNTVIGRPVNARIEVAQIPPGDSLPVPPFSIETNPDYRLLVHDETAAAYDVTIAQGERMPTLSLEGDAGVLGVKPRDFHQDRGYSVLVTAQLPILSWGAIGDRIEQKEFSREQIRMQRELARREIEARWHITSAEFAQTRSNLAAYQANGAEAERNYLAAKSRFAGGAGSNLEVLEAHRLLAETRINYIATLFQLRLLHANLLRLAGVQ